MGGKTLRIYRKNTFFVEERGVLIKKYKRDIPSLPHAHDFLELVFFLHGEGIHHIDGTDHPITPGSFFVVDNGRPHAILPSGTAEYYNVFLTVNFAKRLKTTDEHGNITTAYDHLRAAPENPVAIYFPPETAAEVERYLEEMHLECDSKKQLYDEAMRAWMRLILISCIRYRCRHADHSALKQPEAVLPAAIDYINRNYRTRVTLESVAEKYGYNPAYFGRLFQKSYGLTFHRYLSKKRVEAACGLLITTEQNVAEIAAAVGFGNTTHFYAEFQKLVGCTPGEYRAREMALDNVAATERRRFER